MNMRGVCTTVVFVGVALIVGSWLWPSFVGGRKSWSDAQAKDYAETLAEMHSLNGAVAQAQQQPAQNNTPAAVANSHLAGAAETGAPIDPATATADRLQTKLVAVQQRYATERAALDDARSHGAGIATFLRWLGIGLVVVGLAVLLARQSNNAG
jgi:hypothetical protein